MRDDYSELVQIAARRYWDTDSADEAAKVLKPALDAHSVDAYEYLIGCLLVEERTEEAKHYANVVLETAATDRELLAICTMCRNDVFSRLAFDQHAIHRTALLALARKGNAVIQTEIALYSLRGDFGFSKSDDEFELWIRKAIGATEQIEPVCHLVEYLLDRQRTIEPALIDRLQRAAADEPDWIELRALYRRAHQSTLKVPPSDSLRGDA